MIFTYIKYWGRFTSKKLLITVHIPMLMVVCESEFLFFQNNPDLPTGGFSIYIEEINIDYTKKMYLQMMVQKHQKKNLARFTYQTYYYKISILNIYFIKKAMT